MRIYYEIFECARIGWRKSQSWHIRSREFCVWVDSNLGLLPLSLSALYFDKQKEINDGYNKVWCTLTFNIAACSQQEFLSLFGDKQRRQCAQKTSDLIPCTKKQHTRTHSIFDAYFLNIDSTTISTQRDQKNASNPTVVTLCNGKMSYILY